METKGPTDYSEEELAHIRKTSTPLGLSASPLPIPKGFYVDANGIWQPLDHPDARLRDGEAKKKDDRSRSRAITPEERKARVIAILKESHHRNSETEKIKSRQRQ